ncbi:MAG: isoamylase early set domain-containing protein [Gemmatimonadota bacterium]|nr:isoamylase early set domain-containing protein [Gemmatimonadota bacterium]
MDEHAGLLGKAIDALRELPDVRPEATAKLLIAIAAERQRERDRSYSTSPSRWIWTGMTAAAVVIATALAMPSMGRRGVAPAASRGTAATVPQLLTSASAINAAEAPRPVELVFSAPAATSVRVVGDFNGWDERTAPMLRDNASGLWSVRLMLRPGRHVYAFVVNDTQWMRDPRATAAPDADFGRPGSVVLVGRP